MGEDGFALINRNDTGSGDSTPTKISIQYKDKESDETFETGPAKIYAAKPVDPKNLDGTWELVAEVKTTTGSLSNRTTSWNKKVVFAPSSVLEKIDEVYFDSDGTFNNLWDRDEDQPKTEGKESPYDKMEAGDILKDLGY